MRSAAPPKLASIRISNEKVNRFISGISFSRYLSFAEEVEHFKYLILSGLLVDSDVSDVAKQGEVDAVSLVFLIVFHELVEAFVLLTIE